MSINKLLHINQCNDKISSSHLQQQHKQQQIQQQQHQLCPYVISFSKVVSLQTELNFKLANFVEQRKVWEVIVDNSAWPNSTPATIELTVRLNYKPVGRKTGHIFRGTERGDPTNYWERRLATALLIAFLATQSRIYSDSRLIRLLQLAARLWLITSWILSYSISAFV